MILLTKTFNELNNKITHVDFRYSSLKGIFYGGIGTDWISMIVVDYNAIGYAKDLSGDAVVLKKSQLSSILFEQPVTNIA